MAVGVVAQELDLVHAGKCRWINRDVLNGGIAVVRTGRRQLHFVSADADGAFAAVGIQGQNIYINPARRVVIVTFGAQPKPVGKEPVDPMAFFDAVAAALD